MSIEVGSIVEGKVSGITPFGAFVDLPEGKTGLVHISEVARDYVKDIKEHLTPNQQVKVKVISVDKNGKIALSIKRVTPENPTPTPTRPDDDDWFAPKPSGDLSFEEKMAEFKKTSSERMLSLKINESAPHRPRKK